MIERARTEEDGLWGCYQPDNPIRIHDDPNDPNRNFPVGKGVTSLSPDLLVAAFGRDFLMFATRLIMSGVRHQAATKRAPP